MKATRSDGSFTHPPEPIAAMLERNGFALRKQWVDATAHFALTLVEAK